MPERMTVHPEIAKAAITTETEPVETSGGSAATTEGLAADAQPHPFSAAVAAGESSVRGPLLAASRFLAARSAEMA